MRKGLHKLKMPPGSESVSSRQARATAKGTFIRLYLAFWVSSVLLFFGISQFLVGFLALSWTDLLRPSTDFDSKAKQGGVVDRNLMSKNVHDVERVSPGLLKPRYGRVVVMLVDALRADMVFGQSSGLMSKMEDPAADVALSTYMPYLTNKLARKEAMGFVAYAHNPTVTMPRLKAMTTGRISSFTDGLANFNAQQLREDNIISLAASAGKRVVFYGDDTWLKLFPSQFVRSEGTSGFLTTDTVEVDNNVTRHLQEELDPSMTHPKSSDWDMLILHYLGLDHVGHLRGPHSDLMKAKLTEMDALVEKIDNAIQSQDVIRQHRNKRGRGRNQGSTVQESLAGVKREDSRTQLQRHNLEQQSLGPREQQEDQAGSVDTLALPTLFVLCSDHGMTDSGNHGGVAKEETSAVTMFVNLPSRDDSVMSPPTNTDNVTQSILQVDLVPTLTNLLGLFAPARSVGRNILSVLTSADTPREECVSALASNAQSFLALLQESDHSDAHEEYAFQKTRLESSGVWSVVTQMGTSERLDHIGGWSDARIADTLVVLSLATERMQRTLIAQRGEYSTGLMVLGLSIMAVSLLLNFRHLTTTVVRKFASNSRICLAFCLIVAYLTGLAGSSTIENEHAVSFHLASGVVFCYMMQEASTYASTSSPRTQSDGLTPQKQRHQHLGSILFSALSLALLRLLRARNQVINFAMLNGLEGSGDQNTSILTSEALVPWGAEACVLVILLVACVEEETRKFLLSSSRAFLSTVNLLLSGSLCYVYVSKRNEGSKGWEGTTECLYLGRCVLALLAVSCMSNGLWLLKGWRNSCNKPGEASLSKVAYRRSLRHIEASFWLLAACTTRPQNLPSLALLALLGACSSRMLASSRKSSGNSTLDWPISFGVVLLLYGRAGFFALGNSHTVSTVDISGVYIGHSSYNQITVGALTVFTTFSGPVLCFLSFWRSILAEVVAGHRTTNQALACFSAFALLQSLLLVWYCIVVFAVRYHLFIWSVFAPKLCYEVCFTLLGNTLALLGAAPLLHSS